ncbi:glyoxalase superfamily protein [Iodobacter sp. CM08]|uniref:glyoxalase superfamily protein n=1 Tax=Iodobacter sp. CM08 TaxID=3085902 RepID=UPI002981556E|nr:glyoxalase superfamily protein [Iodobacter sp. CM08]MDW5418092.1 glyoxalase superfamily protein [Iodobacter sp. CM08]
MAISLREAKLQADRLSSRLKMLGVDIKRTQALEAVAAVYNFPNWLKFKDSLDKHHGPAPQASTADRGPHRILLLRPGEGKTSIMAMLFENEVKKKQSIPLWITCGETLPQHILSDDTLESVSIITADFSDEGEILALPGLDKGSTGIWVRLHHPAMSPHTPHGRSIRAKAMIGLLASIKREWPERIASEINWCLIDEFNRLDQNHPGLLNSALPDFAGTNITLVISTPHLPSAAPPGYRIISSRGTAELPMKGLVFCTAKDVVIADDDRNIVPGMDSPPTYVEGIAKQVLGAIRDKENNYPVRGRNARKGQAAAIPVRVEAAGAPA